LQNQHVKQETSTAIILQWLLFVQYHVREKG